VTMTSRIRSVTLIGGAFVVAGIVSACGGSSSSAGTAAAATTVAATQPAEASAATSAVATAAVAAAIAAAAVSSPAATSAVPTTAAPTTAPTTKAPTTKAKPVVRLTTKSASPTMTMTMSPTPKPTTTSPKPATTSPKPTTTSPKPTTTSPKPTTTPPPSVVTVTAAETEFKIALSRTSFSAGTVVFIAENKGTATHALGISGPGVDRSTDDLAPGQSARLTVTLAKGTYDIYCPIGNHKMLGMDVHITVS
jgi:uncharacterized cupredoxin-like copper-binding protein